MFSRVVPLRRPKYFGFGRASMLRTGTTNRVPSTASDQPTTPDPGRGDPGLADDERGVGLGVILRAHIILVHVTDPRAGQRRHPGGYDRGPADVQRLRSEHRSQRDVEVFTASR